MIKKAITMLLIISMLAAFTSCSDAATGNPTDPNKATTTDAGTGQATTASELSPDLPERDFEGAVINFLVRGEAIQPTNFSVEIYSEEMTGEPINDAVYNRNKYVEEKFNVSITETSTDDSIENVRKSVLSGDGAYDVAMMRLSRVTTLAREGHLSDLTNMPYVDLSKPWWDKNAVDNLRMGDNLYFATGDINIMDNNAIWATMFNKKLFSTYGIAYPYELVRTGKWTLDKFIEYVKLGGKDLDGNDIMDEFDEYGLIYALENTFPLILSSGARLTALDGDKNLTMDVDTDKINAVLDKVINIVKDKSKSLLCEDYSCKYNNPWSEVMRASFREGRGLLYISGLLSGTYLRDMEDDFGIVPLPKFDESQEQYHSWMNLNNASTLCIPVNNDNPEMVGIIVEALAAKSMDTLTPAYYDVTLSGKVARDEDSIEMLDIILSSVVFDFGNIYNLGGINDIFLNIVKKSSNTFMSDYEAISEKLKKQVEEINEEVKALK